jgi:hypothetical protein|tara:strand:- start:1741 stop:2052 length:312 start_codon:yes stop_codon:yes gene_type:complete
MGYILRKITNDVNEVGIWEANNIVNENNTLMVFDTTELAEEYKATIPNANDWSNRKTNEQWVWQRRVEILDESDKDNYIVWIEKLDGTMAIHVWESNTWVERV